MTARELAYGCLYVAGHQAWAWGVRSGVDPWARRLAGRRLGVDVAWVPTTTFPIAVWAWGLAARLDARLDARLAAASVGFAFAGALAPAVVTGLLLRAVGCSPHLAHAIYLMTLPLAVLFVALQMTRRAGAPAEDMALDEDRGRGSRPQETRVQPESERGVL